MVPDRQLFDCVYGFVIQITELQQVCDRVKWRGRNPAVCRAASVLLAKSGTPCLTGILSVHDSGRLANAGASRSKPLRR